jgi:hypothetical protein
MVRRELLPIQGSSEITTAYLSQQERYYQLLVPEALEMMHGIADGAATELSASAFPRELSHFHKILMINSYYGLKGKPPVSSTAELASTDDDIHCCSGAVILGPATRDGKAIHVSSEDQHFFPQEYLVTFIANPTDRRANRFTVTDSAGEIGRAISSPNFWNIREPVTQIRTLPFGETRAASQNADRGEVIEVTSLGR